MRNKKNCIAVMACALIVGMAGCASAGQQTAAHSVQQKMIPVTTSAKSRENSQKEQTDTQLEEELKRYRQEREDMIQESNGLVEGGTPDEDNYTFDRSEAFYAGQFDARELTEAYAAARTYVKDTLKINPGTKMATYMCVDPRILAIYDDKDKGAAAGYENSNIFVCEYRNEDGRWQYLVLVRHGKGSAWNVIHNGSSYKK